MSTDGESTNRDRDPGELGPPKGGQTYAESIATFTPEKLERELAFAIGFDDPEPAPRAWLEALEAERAKRRKARHAQLWEHYNAENDDMTPDGDSMETGRYVVVMANASHQDGERSISTWATFEEAAAHAGDQILDGFSPLDGIFDLDTGAMIELHVSTPVVTRSEDQGIMVNPLQSGEPHDDDGRRCDCAGIVPGALYPWRPGGDDSLPWVEACDDCRGGPDGFDTDTSAALAVAQKIGGYVAWAALDGDPQDIDHARPFVLTREQLDAINAPRTFVHVVDRPNEVDGIYVFEREEDAETFTARFGDDAIKSEETVITAADAPKFLAETEDEDEDDPSKGGNDPIE